MRLMRNICGLAVAVAVWAGPMGGAADTRSARLTIYVDADFSHMPAPAEAIELGLRTAFKGTWAEEGIEIIRRDHRMNSRRSFDTMIDAQNDPNAIAVVGGMHSPPYIVNGHRINELGVPLLLPWSAAGSLTRLNEGDDNWIFRLSVDDTLAGQKLAEKAITRACSRPSIIVVDNPWGQGNKTRIQDALARAAVPAVETIALPGNASARAVSNATIQIDAANSDCVLLVADFFLGADLLNSLADLGKPPDVISHWGILGRNLGERITSAKLSRLKLRILGTCGLHLVERRTFLHQRAIEAASGLLGHPYNPSSEPAPHGFYHGHDLGLLVLTAIHSAKARGNWPEDPAARRAAVRQAMHRLDLPTYGLLKTYVTPFSPVSSDNRRGHEALGAEDLCYTAPAVDGTLIPI